MQSRELCKLDRQSPDHVGLRRYLTDIPSQTGMLREFSARFTDSAMPTDAARASGIARARERFAEGQISEARLLSALSRATGLQIVSMELTPPDAVLSGILSPQFCLKHACLPWRQHENILWIATSRPEDFEKVRDEISRLEPEGIHLVIPVLAPRDAIQNRIASTHRDVLTEKISQRVDIRHSCRSWKPKVRLRILQLSAGALILCAITVYAPKVVLLAVLSWTILTLFVASVLKLTSAIAHRTIRNDTRLDVSTVAAADLPSISILVPLFRERQIAEVLAKRMEQLVYPFSKLEVILVLEEEDDVTREVLERTRLPNWMRVVVVPDGQPRTKPRAMNYALDFCKGDIIGIYDAEDAPDPDQLLRVATHFANAPKDVVCLQGALDFYNAKANWLARCFTIEYNTWFRLVLPGMAKLGFAVPLGGTTLFFKRKELEELGAWDAHNVTEDADLGFRLARAGYRTEVIDTTTREEANNRTIPWIKQRSRWLKGYLVTYLVHMRNPVELYRDLGAWRFMGFQVHFVSALSQFALAPLLWSFWFMLFGMSHPLLSVLDRSWIHGIAWMFIAVEMLTVTLSVMGTHRPQHRHLWHWIPTLQFYWPLGCFAMWKALYELAFNPFYWDKTQHGHSLPDADHSTDETPPESSFNRVTNALEM